ncbi:hypothetical protein [Sphingomonas sp. S-NIH.Pt1_0416]|uniref:hypothetical protein n=1 Tax=Sphingomonas sp. S-NIH.Pt1_0416 TaxID=1920123 RepID=UPI000F7EEA16|nr:hypothetical protein [Sphingomonas sp. S-NIH.Pt1_0416]
MTDDDRAAADRMLIQALDDTDHPDKAVSLLMTAAMTIMQRRYGAEKAVEHMTQALDVAGASIRRAIHGGAAG